LSPPLYLLKVKYSGRTKDHSEATNGATFVGSKNCKSCHKQEYEKWQNSHHDRAMDFATPETVLGDFNDRQFTHFDLTSESLITFNGPGKFDIRAMWSGGHSWGAMYVAGGFTGSGYACLPELADRMKGAVIMSGGVAKNSGVVALMAEKLGDTIHVPKEPRIVGALGAALHARRIYHI